MQNKKQTTQEKILYAAKAEFLEKGFQTASLRTIVKEAWRYHRGTVWLLRQQGSDF